MSPDSGQFDQVTPNGTFVLGEADIGPNIGIALGAATFIYFVSYSFTTIKVEKPTNPIFFSFSFHYFASHNAHTRS